MKYFFLVFTTVVSLCASAVNVTFQVDMGEQVVSANGVHLAGNFQNWDPASTPLSDLDGDGIYIVTLDIPAGFTLEYKFINGNTWGSGEESVPSGCGVSNGFGGFNRSNTLGPSDLTIPAVCFSSCSLCSYPGCTDPLACNFDASANTDDGSCFSVGDACDDNNSSTTNDAVQGDCVCAGVPVIPTLIIFQVDMANVVVDANGVFVAGDFNNWDPTATQMTSAGGSVYQAVVFLNPGVTTGYKFINGNAWTGAETVPASCGQDDGGGNINRSYTASASMETLPPVCFSACVACVPLTYHTVTFTVNMSEQPISPDGVHVAGNFQNWDPAGTVMTDMGNGIFQYSTSVLDGVTVQYKFINGNAWSGAENVDFACSFNDGNGNYNRQWIANADQVLDTVCFGQCVNCPPVVVDYLVLFQVDMSNESVSPNGVHVASNVNGWDPAAITLNDIGGGIYEGFMPVQPNQSVFFRFVNGNTVADMESVPQACGVLNGNGSFERVIAVGESNAVFGPVCFSQCSACVPLVPVNVTFQLNLGSLTPSANGVHIAGDFQGWDPNATPMSDSNGDNVFEYALTVPQGSVFTYKFINGNDWSSAELVPPSCGIADGFGAYNRYAISALNDTVFAPVCLGSCSNCVEPVDSVSMVLQVDMSGTAIQPEGAYLISNLNGFSPVTPFSSTNSTFYYFTVNVPQNSVFKYRFVNGTDVSMAESVPDVCGTLDQGGVYYRTIAVDSVGFEVPMVCFNQCLPCISAVMEKEVFNPIFPNPASDHVMLPVQAQGTVFNAQGQVVVKYNGTQSGPSLDVSQWPAGMYWFHSEQGTWSFQLIR